MEHFKCAMDRITHDLDEYHLLERIYAASLDSDLWQAAITDIERALTGSVMLLEFDERNRHTGRFCSQDRAAWFLDKMNSAKVGTGRSVLDFLLMHASEGDPLNQYDFTTLGPDLPAGQNDSTDGAVTATVLQTGSNKILLTCQWPPAASNSNGTQKGLLKRLAKHLSNAMSHSRKYSRMAARTSALETMVRHQPVPSLLVDRNLVVISATPACEQHFKSESLFRLIGQRLVPTVKELEKILDAAVQDIDGALRPFPEHSMSPLSRESVRDLICMCAQKRTYRVVVRSVVQEKGGLEPGRKGYIHIQVREPSPIPMATKEYLETEYALSNSEARLAYHLATSGSFADTLDLLSITRNTGKTHLRRIYEKTGAQSQAELCTLVSTLGRMF